MLDLCDIRIHPIRRRRREASPVLVSDPLRIIQDRFDLCPHGALETVAAHRAIGAHRLAIEAVAIAANAAIGAVAKQAGGDSAPQARAWPCRSRHSHSAGTPLSLGAANRGLGSAPACAAGSPQAGLWQPPRRPDR